MDVIDEQSHFTFELFITALKNGYDNDINGFLLFQLSTFDSEEKAYSAFKLISYLFETHEQETLAYFSWGAFSQFVKFEHEDETWISFCSMINSVFKYDTAQAELSLKYHIDDFLLGVFQNSSFSLKEIAIETLANLAKVNMENLLSKGYVTILIDFLCVPNDDLFILLVNSLFYLAFYAKGGKLTTEIATQFAECELALTLEGILNTGLSENCERLSVALMNNVCELTEFLS
ncbi:hypothetical protein GPJ56_002594 [Histomonas meleagridis]|uniref:uncharacterized protein n=1 Tax=Histomonas meleagridis TaxID=135588 RepID=UPI00355A28FD|nr:hypothetical protein GPJ56_002594 [Histomonas meleagridis]KAH0801386.1 hypothetical protein GO595_005981 [Histomonas meleagridis]